VPGAVADIKTRHLRIPWQAVAGFRNHIAHEYFSLDLDIVWRTIETDVPVLEANLRQILHTEAPGLVVE